jgi:hypothetical protein
MRDQVGRFSLLEMKNYEKQMDESIPKSHDLAYHLCNKESVASITSASSLGIRASKVGQNAGGLSCSRTPPSGFEWDKYCSGKFRENVGKALWGSKWQEVEVGGVHADKLDVLIVMKVPKVIMHNQDNRVAGRDERWRLWFDKNLCKPTTHEATTQQKFPTDSLRLDCD